MSVYCEIGQKTKGRAISILGVQKPITCNERDLPLELAAGYKPERYLKIKEEDGNEYFMPIRTLCLDCAREIFGAVPMPEFLGEGLVFGSLLDRQKSFTREESDAIGKKIQAAFLHPLAAQVVAPMPLDRLLSLQRRGYETRLDWAQTDGSSTP